MLIFNPQTPSGPMVLHRLTLAFQGRHRHLEERFAAHYFEENLSHLRLCHWLTLFFYSLPGVLDASFFPEMKTQLWTIRYMVVCPVFLLGLAFTYTAAYRRWWQPISMGYILMTGGGFIWMIAIAPPPTNHGYYVGIIISMMFGYTLIRERFIFASTAGLLLLAAYVAVSLTMTPIPANLLFHNSFFIFATNMLGMLIAYFLEFSARRNYFLAYMLKGEQKKVQDLNTRLEHKVARRTQALSAANEALLNEIAEREMIETTLREERERLKILFDFAPDGYCMLDRQGKVIEGNRSAEIISGYGREALIGLQLHHGGLIPRSSFAQVRAIRRASRKGRPWGPGEFAIRRRDGTPATVQVRSHPVRFSSRDSILLMVRDVTEEKVRARANEQLERQLAHAQKMEAVGTLAGGIAHDFNNILSAILGYTELSRLDAVPGGSMADNLAQIHTAGLRAKDLVRQILAFSRQDDIDIKPVQVDAVVRESLNFLRASIPKTIEIRARLASTSHTLASPTQIQQILMNLGTNAAHAMGPEGGLLEVALQDVVIDGGGELHLPPGEYIRLTVSDTGSGMSPQVRRRLFDPYFTTKPKGEGSGLGMAVVHGIVSRYGGGITVNSEEGRGTSVTIHVPRNATGPLDDVKAAPTTPTGEGAVLLVDDEPQLVAIEKQMLTRLGYRVTACHESTEALDIFRRQPDAFDVVITDMAMPRMNGAALSREILAIRPDMPIILCTGFSADLTDERARAIGVRSVLMKPVSMQILATRLQELVPRRHKPAR